jgi:sugar lactone lactonase YvrE
MPGSVTVDGLDRQRDSRRFARPVLWAGVLVLLVGALAGFGMIGAGDPASKRDTPVAADVFLGRTGFEVFLAGLEAPNDLAFDPDGGLFVSETGTERITRVEILPDGSAGGRVEVAAGIPDIRGLALSGDGVLYACTSNVVYRVAQGVTTQFAEGFVNAQGLAIGPNGDVFVADDADPGGIRISRVEVLPDGTGGAVTEAGIVPGEPAAGIGFEPAGNLVVANNLGSLWAVGEAQDAQVSPLELATFPERPTTLAFDPTGTLYVGSGDSIWSTERGASPSLLVTGLDVVEGLAFDTSGSIYAADAGTNQILRRPDSLLLPVESVRLQGGPFFERATAGFDPRRGFGSVVAPESVIDGVFFDRGPQWDQGPVWWESGAVKPVWGDEQPRWIELDLGGQVTIGSAVVQADENDEYLLSYRDPNSGEWEPLWQIDSISGSFAIQPDSARYIERTIFTEPVTTDRLRFEALSGDGMYSVSEIQVFRPPNAGLGTGAETGTISIQASNWVGVDGHRLFVLVDNGYSVVGGAFWIRVDGDPFAGQDLVHPYRRNLSGGIAEEYLWGETARLEPGTYQITLYLDPVDLFPFGHALPRSPIERQCTIEVEVTAGRNTVAVVGATPGSEFVSCPTP